MTRGAVALAAALTTVGTAACSASSSSPSSSYSSYSSKAAASGLPAVPGMTAEAVRLRTDEAVGGQFQVRITDSGDQPFTVTSVALDSPGFTPLGPKPIIAEYAPGQIIDLPTTYGSPVCGADVQPAGARITVVRPGRSAVEEVVPLAGEVLALIHSEECAVLAVGEVVGITVTGLHEAGNDLLGEVELSRRAGDQPVTVARLGRSVLLAASAPGLPRQLAGGERRLSVPVSFTPASCDPHVLAETKKPYVFPLVVQVGDGAEVPVDLPLDQAAKDQLAALVDRVCRAPG